MTRSAPAQPADALRSTSPDHTGGADRTRSVSEMACDAEAAGGEQRTGGDEDDNQDVDSESSGRVMSLSPKDAEPAQQSVSRTNGSVDRSDRAGAGGAGGAGGADDIFLTPRVVDQQQFATFASELRSLIESAAAVAADLQQHQQNATEHVEQVSSSTTSLQERLKVGARMLQALQSQLDAAESMMQRLEQRQEQLHQAERELDQHLEAFSRHVDEGMTELQRRVDASTDAAIERLNDALQEKQDALLKQLTSQAQEIEPPMVETMNAAGAHSQVTQSLEHMLERFQESLNKDMLRLCDELRNATEQSRRTDNVDVDHQSDQSGHSEIVSSNNNHQR